MFALVSDIHSNLESLLAVLKDIENRGIKKIICLGDIIGYGPNPAECVDLAMKFDVVLRGNHEEAVLTDNSIGFNPLAQKAIDWTRAELKPGALSSGDKKKRWDFLNNLSYIYKEDDDKLFFVHGSPRSPVWEYILRHDTELLFDGHSSKIKDIFSRFEHLCFVGHTHDPGIIIEDSEFLSPREFSNTWECDIGKKAIINIGSVGQPRDGDNRACYVTVNGPIITYHRIEYDIKTTQEKIQGISDLNKRIGERLQYGR